MIVVNAHLDFYREHKPLPGWAHQIVKPARPVSVHDLISVQLPRRTQGEREISNMLATLKLARKNEQHYPGNFMRCLRSYALPTYSTTSMRQAATARKWLKKITGETS